MSIELHLGDCLEFMRGMADKSVDAVITDPPYGMKSHNMRLAVSMMNIDWDENPASDEQIKKILEFDKPTVIWGGNYFNLPPSRCWLVWDKKSFDKMTFADCELAWTNIDATVSIFRKSPQNMDGGKVHPTQKPENLMRWCIEKLTSEGDTIFDPFMGSGTTGVACVQTGRNFIGCEIDEGYFKIAEKRIHDAQQQMRLGI